jgi:hypothetical protein
MFAFIVPMGGKSRSQELVCQDTCLRKAPDCFAHFEVNMPVVHFVVEVDGWNIPIGMSIYSYLSSGTER